MHEIKFTKMHGLGNDFVLIDNRDHSLSLTHKQVTLLADRHLGIGCDQVLLLQASKNADYSCRIYNRDGSEAEQCGNGLRCVAKYIKDNKLTLHPKFNIETKAGIFAVNIKSKTDICVEMGHPEFEPVQLIDIGQNRLEIMFVKLGNPHAIFFTKNLEQVDLERIAKKINLDIGYPHGINVGCLEILTPHQTRLRTHERGAGETSSCGSNACAAIAAGINSDLIDKNVEVKLRHGTLKVSWNDTSGPISLSGPAETVFRGQYFKD